MFSIVNDQKIFLHHIFQNILRDKPQLSLLIKTLFSAKYGAKTHLY